MIVRSVRTNNRKRAFEVRTSSRDLCYPYSELELRPSKDDPVDKVVCEPEISYHGFTYTLMSGRTETVHVGQILEWDRDPSYLAELLLHRLSLAAREAVESSPLSKRAIIRRLGTSASQFYRLLDPTNVNKAMGQVVALIHAAGQDVDFTVARPPGEGKDGR